jgi:hypothetical protein
MEQHAFKMQTIVRIPIYPFYLENSGGQKSNLYLNFVHFSVN